MSAQAVELVLICLSPGSILVSCAHFGSYAAGSDVNRTLLHGRGKC